MKKAPVCKKGFPCGKTCISRTRLCWANLSTKDKKMAENFVQFINRLVGVQEPEETEAVVSTPELKSRDDILSSISESEILEEIEKNAEELSDIDDEDEAKYSDAFINYNRGIAQAVVGYTKEDYVDINNYLRNKELIGVYIDANNNNLLATKKLEDSDPEVRDIAKKIKVLDEAYKQLKPLAEDVVVYRGIARESNTDLSQLENLKPGDSYEDPAFVSASPERDLAEMFAEGAKGYGVLLEIKVNGNSPNAKDIQSLNNMGENEILINRGTKFVVDSIEETTINGEAVKKIVLKEAGEDGERENNFDINQELDKKNYIGGGVYGEVYQAADNPNIVIKKGLIGDDEVRIAKKLQDAGFQHGIKIIDRNGDRIAMEKISGVRLQDLPEADRIKLKPQIMEAMKQMGELGVAHNDIHSGNIIYNKDEDKVYIIDYGLAEDEEVQFLDGPNPAENNRRNIIKDAAKVLQTIQDISKLKGIISLLNSKYNLGISNINELFIRMNSPQFVKLMKIEDNFNEIFGFIYG